MTSHAVTVPVERNPRGRPRRPADDAATAYTVLSLLDDLTFWTRRRLFTADDVSEGVRSVTVTHERAVFLLERLRRAGYVQATPGPSGLAVTPLGRQTLRHLRVIQRRSLPLPLG